MTNIPDNLLSESGQPLSDNVKSSAPKKRAPSKPKIKKLPVDLPVVKNDDLFSPDTGAGLSKSYSDETNIKEKSLVQEPEIIIQPVLGRISNNWFMVTNRYNLLTMLATGMIAPAEQSWRYQDDSRSLHAGNIPLWKGLIPSLYSKLLKGKAIDSPVILEFKYEFSEFIGNLSDEWVVYSGVIPFSYVEKIKFLDEDNLNDFQLRLTDDIPRLPDSMYEFRFPQINSESVSSPANVIDSQFFPVNQFDKLLGGLSVMLSGISTRSSSGKLFTEAVYFMLTMMRDAMTLDAKNNPRTTTSNLTEHDEWLYIKTLEWLSNLTPEKGFVPSEYLLHIRKLAETKKIEAVVKWCDSCQAIISGEKEFLEFNDSRNFMQRGVVLFLLRFDQERFAKLESSRFKPGHKVYTIAASLVGFYTGMTMIEPTFKMSWQNHYRAVKEFILAIKHNQKIDSKDFTVVCEENDIFQANLALQLSNVTIAKWRSELDSSLKKLQFSDQHEGITTKPDFLTGELVCKFKEDPQFTVRIKLLSPSTYGKVARIYGVCGDKFKNDSKLLMTMNGFENYYGKFAWDDAGRLIYAQDQMIKTCDEDELHAHIRHIHDVIKKS